MPVSSRAAVIGQVTTERKECRRSKSLRAHSRALGSSPAVWPAQPRGPAPSGGEGPQLRIEQQDLAETGIAPGRREGRHAGSRVDQIAGDEDRPAGFAGEGGTGANQ